MSTREKAMNLLQEMPESSLETVYEFMQFIFARQDHRAVTASAFGIAHKYANPALIEEEEGAFERAMVQKILKT